ncbi:LysR family transcriptional regulator [Sphingomonas parva]|uniref:LysR family transcriptional regulator n=1 Tax=Sphingomonas parva TaxID=2555898 RepID=A0A4Y8ZY59_9SPHN|nr:LysR substrate-binding domain-containing protein [Sphingomonas parva]TFI59849.1 LysR family transcriptional regulator [Sphingomonas parva]
MISPPLPILRTFEAAARHGSFARAASELNVTPAAVSQQMRLLEQRLGVKLFSRRARGLTVTSAGRDYAAKVAGALAQIEAATRALGSSDRAGILQVATFASFATFWLLPRLAAFRNSFPEIDLRLSLSLQLASLSDGATDVAIRFGSGVYEDGRAAILMEESAVAVCSPSLLAGRAIARRPDDLAGLPLIRDAGLIADESALQWRTWIGEQEARHRFVNMPDGMMSLQAALLGQGVALTRRSLAADLIREGRLVRLLDEERPTNYKLWLVVPHGPENPRTSAFSNWVLDQVGAQS